METPGSPASGRKQPMIVSLFSKLMTPTKKEEEPASRVEVQQLGEEVDKLRKIIEMHEGLMKTPLGKQIQNQETPSRSATKIKANLLEQFQNVEEEDSVSSSAPQSTPNRPALATPRSTHTSATPAPITTPAKRTIPTPFISTPVAFTTPRTLKTSAPLATPALGPPPLPPANLPPATPFLGAPPLPPTTPCDLPPPPPPIYTPAQIVPGTPSVASTTANSRLSDAGNSSVSSDVSAFSLSDSDISGSVDAFFERSGGEQVDLEENSSFSSSSSATSSSSTATSISEVAPESAVENMEISTPAETSVLETSAGSIEEIPSPAEVVVSQKEEESFPSPVNVEVVESPVDSLTLQIKELKDKEATTAHENKLLKGLVMRKDNEIRDWRNKATTLEQSETTRKQAEEQLEEMKRECESLRSILESKDCVLKEKETEIEEKYKPLAEQLNNVNTERRQLFNQVLELKGNIRVFCRVRPLSASELTNGEKNSATFPVEGSIMIQNKKYDFDKVFDPSVDQAGVFNEVQPLVVSVMDGFNVCLFCYGQTGSGKTWTMEGAEDNRGVYYRALEELFQMSAARALTCKYTVSVSVLEIYNENVRDLLCSEQGKKLDIRTGANGVIVPDLSSHEVSNMSEVLNLMAMGAKHRAVGSTNQNEHSSRSHCMVSITVNGENLVTGVTSTARLHLVDLAGSERLSKTLAEGDRLKEAQNINKSLSALGEVVNHLVAKNSHIPYRNSKLTHLLMDCLGGDSKTLMFVHINPSDQSSSESVCSLNFASRARSVENGPAKRHTDAEYVKLRETTKKKDETIEQLRAQLKAAEEKAQKAEDKYRNLFLQREAAKPAPTPIPVPVLTEITNTQPTNNYVSILRDPSTPGKRANVSISENSKIVYEPPSNLSKSVLFDVSKENSENGEDKVLINSRVRFAEETRNAPAAKRLRGDAPVATTSNTSSLSISLPLRNLSQPTASSTRLASLRSSTTKVDTSSPLKSANWNNSLRGGPSKPLPLSLPKRQPTRSLPQRTLKK